MPEENLDWLDEDWENEKPQANTKVLSSLARKFKAIYLQHFRPIYLIFDQFEELYILGTKAEQAQFVEIIKEILRLEQPIKVIFSIREEYLGYLYEFEKAVPELLRKKLRVEPMNLDKVRNVLLGVHQLKNTQIHLEEGKGSELAEIIFDKIKGKEKTLTIQLPYLQVFLDKLYMNISQDEARKAEATFTLAALAQMGDIDNVLRDFLEEQAGKIAKTLGQQLETIWKILSPFVTLEGTKEPLNEAQLAQRLPHLDRQLISQTVKAFTDSRILRFMEDEQLYEIAHDSLAKQISEKRTDEEIAILEVQRLIKTQTSVKEEAREYFTEKQLGFVEPYLDKMLLAEQETAWIALSKQYIQQQKEKERLRQAQELQEAKARAEKERNLSRRAYYVAAFALLIAVMAGVFYFQAEQATKEADKQKKVADSKTQEALKSATEAEKERNEADSLAKIAKQQEENATKQTQIAQGALVQAEQEKQKALSLLDQIALAEVASAETAMNQLDFGKALQHIRNASISQDKDVKKKIRLTLADFLTIGIYRYPPKEWKAKLLPYFSAFRKVGGEVQVNFEQKGEAVLLADFEKAVVSSEGTRTTATRTRATRTRAARSELIKAMTQKLGKEVMQPALKKNFNFTVK